MRVALAPCVASGGDAHQAGVQAVLQIALQNAVFNQHIALRGVALVVHVERTAPIGQGAIVEHRHALGRHALANAPTERARPLAVEVALQPVAHGLVQQHTGPTGAQYHGHLPSRCRARLQVDQRGLHGFLHVRINLCVIKVGQAKAPAPARRAHFTALALLGNDGERQAHQRTHISRQGAIGTRHQHHVVLACQARHDLHDARVLGPGTLLDGLQQAHLGCTVERSNGVGTDVQIAAFCYLLSSCSRSSSLACSRN